MIHSNAFSNLITKSTRVSKTLQTISDRILSNDIESIVTPKVFFYKIYNHFSIMLQFNYDVICVARDMKI